MQPIDVTFTGTIMVDATSGWTCVLWPDSVATLGTGRTIKVSARVDEVLFDVTLMPSGTGCHFVPLKAATRKLLKKDVGDSVTICIVAKI